jgi:hypothetical protein
VYALPPDRRTELWVELWPWGAEFYKPGDRIRELTKAGALIAAAIDSLRGVAPSAAQHDFKGAACRDHLAEHGVVGADAGDREPGKPNPWVDPIDYSRAGDRKPPAYSDDYRRGFLDGAQAERRDRASQDWLTSAAPADTAPGAHVHCDCIAGLLPAAPGSGEQ